MQLSPQQVAHVTAVVLSQLQGLLGVAPAEPATTTRCTAAVSLRHLPAGPAGFAAWQVDVLMRQRAAHAVREAARVLAALSTLVQELPNLEMPSVIAQQVGA